MNVNSSTLQVNQIDNNHFTLTLNSKINNPSVLLFIDYTKGNEDRILFEFEIYEKNLDKYSYLSSLTIENIAVRRQVKIVESDKLVIPVNIPLNSDKLIIHLNVVGDTSSGSINIDHRIIDERY